jgi:hypothetical protein
MCSGDFLYLTKSILVRGLSKKQFDVLVDVSLKLNDLRNCAVESTYLIKKNDNTHYKKINYKSIIKKVKSDFSDVYSFVQAHLANAAIHKHVDSFNAYIALRNKKIDQKYNRSLHKPKKHDKARLSNIIIPGQSITCSKKKLSEGYIELPLSREYKKQLESKDCRPRIKIPENIRDKIYTGGDYTYKKWDDV